MITKKISFQISCVMIFILFLTGCGSKSTDAGAKVNEVAQITLKVATWTPAESYYSKELFEPFMEKVTSLTDGQVQFEYYPAEQLGKAADSLSLVSSGIADISLFSPSFTPSEMPISAAMIGMPGLYETTPQGATAYYKVAQQSPTLEKDFLNNGVRPVALSITPFYEIFTNKKEIKVPDDLKGFKISASGGVFTEALNYAGSTPVMLTTSDLYSALSSGVIDGLHYITLSVDSFGFSELTKYATRGMQFGAAPVGLIINENVFQDLPQDIQEVIQQVGEDMGKSFTDYMAVNDKKVFDNWKEAGEITLHELSEGEKQQWKNFYGEFEHYWLGKQDSEEFKRALKMFKVEIEK